MPAYDTILLPPGTNKQAIINMPIAGGWLGGVHFSIVSWPTTSQVLEMIFIADQGRPTTFPTLFRTIPPFTMTINYRYGWFLQRYESAVKIKYTSTNYICANIESSRNAQPVDYQ